MSKEYPNVMFVFYYVKKQDLKKAEWYMSLDNNDKNKKNNKGYELIKNKSQYPLSYYFVGTSDIMIQGTGITPNIIDNAYKKLEKYFLTDKEKFLLPKNENENKIKNKIENPQEEYKKNILLQKEMQYTAKLEKEKLNEKIKVIADYSEKYLKDFVSDIQKREKIENGTFQDSDNSDSSDSNKNNKNNKNNKCDSDDSDSDTLTVRWTQGSS